MKRFKALAVLLVILIMSLPSQAFAATAGVSIIVDGLLQRLDPPPISVDGNTLVEAKQMFELVGITKYNVKNPERNISFNRGNTLYALLPDDIYARNNGRSVPLRVAPKLIDGKLFIPLRFVTSVIGVAADWDATTNTVILDTRAKDYSVISAVEKNADYSNYTVYTVNDAVAKLYDESNDIKVYKKSITDAEDTLSDLEWDYGDLEKITAKTDSESLTWADLKRKLIKYQNQIKDSNIKIELFNIDYKNKIASSARQIESSEYDILLAERKIALDEINIKNMELKLSLGYETETNVKKERDNLSQSKLNLSAAKISLKNAKLDLNKLLKLEKSTLVHITLPENPTKAFSIPDMDKFIKTSTEHNLRIEQSRLRYTEQQTYYDSHYALISAIRERPTPEGTKTEKDADVNEALQTAEYNYETAKSDLSFSITKAYNQLRTLNEQYKTKELDRLKAIDQYKSALVLYQTGSATSFSVQQAELSILSAEIAIMQNRASYANALYSLEHTEALMTGAG